VVSAKREVDSDSFPRSGVGTLVGDAPASLVRGSILTVVWHIADEGASENCVLTRERGNDWESKLG